ncbi:bacillithiol biosynthesis cysteine-adding enzyme BshC [Paraliobacillus ryukyuensis]|uniref:bacillithiol biosynthesis cysteine-adding enzyme BshC n=1 Tax=Paraliobacillus ryukyuensis TaxID=200904 RepID=UPI0009A5DE87|nr:bacillithiol biosynthesis cysteine-adding enzyme BshC [Paraliobacillus ryukyuensis]
MHIFPVTTSQQTLLRDYYQQNQLIMNKFEYNPFDKEAMIQRLENIKERTYNREQLVDVLIQLNKRWGAEQQTFHNIELLHNSNSVVVIGGQQAGLLSGPLYTIHKIISILTFAKQQSQRLGVPVIPVFWIAGEDHDFDEINHIMIPNNGKLKKHRFDPHANHKNSVSSMKFDHDEMVNWVNKLFQSMEETTYSKSLYSLIIKRLKQSSTYVDFFAQLIQSLFKEEGVVLIDSGDPAIRQLESSAFQEMITKQPSISRGVFQQLQKVKQAGYSVSVDVEENDGHLFYHVNGDRILLMKQDDGTWEGKNQECKLTTDELLTIAEQTPERLSNNVVTRPVMQEWLFPTLAFIAGPGELGYWSILKPAFQALDLTMPPVCPRISITLLDRKSEKFSEQYGISIEEVINHGVEYQKINWLRNQQTPPLDQLVEQITEAMTRIHQPLRDVAAAHSPDLKQISEKNLAYIHQHVTYLQKAIEKESMAKHQRVIRNFDAMQLLLRPDNGLQERCWNIVSFLNQYGFEWLNQLIQYEYSFSGKHYVAKL